MDVRLDGQQGPLVTGIDPIVADIRQVLITRPEDWLKTLQHDPGKFVDLEQEIHHVFSQMADRVVAGLLAQATADASFAQASKKR